MKSKTQTYLLNFSFWAALALVCLSPILVALHGCATVDPGQSTFVVRVEQTQEGAAATFDFVLQTDQLNRGFWRTNAPAFHNFCEWLRTPVPFGQMQLQRALAMQANVQELKKTYKTNRDAGSSNQLYLAWQTLSTAISQANSWSNIVVLPVH